MKITVDTNVLISATFWNGSSDKILELVEMKYIELILSKEIIDEYVRVLNYKDILDKIKEKNLELKRSVEKIISLCMIVEPKEKIKIVRDDPSDDKFFECANAGKVNFIISKDKHLLNIKQFEEIKVVTPEEFLKVFL